jgi:hypothetical protein
VVSSLRNIIITTIIIIIIGGGAIITTTIIITGGGVITIIITTTTITNHLAAFAGRKTTGERRDKTHYAYGQVQIFRAPFAAASYKARDSGLGRKA